MAFENKEDLNNAPESKACHEESLPGMLPRAKPEKRLLEPIQNPLIDEGPHSSNLVEAGVEIEESLGSP